ncbi:MAG: polyketide synthase [Kiritimatiellia bacterium]
MEACPIAIVGVACRFAGAPDPGAFWRLIMHRECALAPFGVDLALAPGAVNLFNRPYPTHGGLLGDLYACVPRDITFPRQINAGENQDLYFAVQLAFDALADAGMRPHAPDPLRGTVRFGYAPPFSSSTVNWLEHTFFVDQTLEILRGYFRTAPVETLNEVRAKLIESLPAPDAASFLSGSGHRIAGWIARECSFSGGATTLDAGMLSGIASLRAAMDDLRSGRADVALAGALTPPLNRSLLEGLSGEILFSEASELVPFDRDAKGTIPGEGGAFFVLKREADALRAHDRIYALVRAVACGSAPMDELLAAAAQRAGTPLQSIQLIEGDGCGIPEYDAAEVAAVQNIWGEHRPGGPLVGIGSVKGNIGHCFRASAAAAILKTALALRRKVLPPQIPTERPLEALAHLGSSAYLLNEARPWITGDPSSPRRAAVMVGDVSGRRAALVLEEEPTTEDRT